MSKKNDKFNNDIKNILNSFDESRAKINAKLEEPYILFNDRLKKIASDFEQEKSLSLEELSEIRKKWDSETPFIDYKGNPFVLYIPDWSSFGRYGQPKKPEKDNGYRKFHFSWCATLEKMEKKGRSDRYIRKGDIENTIFNGKNANNEDIQRELQTCIDCRKKMDEKNIKNIYFERNKMDLVRFFELYGKQDLGNDMKYYDKPYSVKYPKSWEEISLRLREKAKWKCSECDEDFSNKKWYLDVHHKNGIKNDTSRNNLIVLCKKCHGKQPNHSHYKKLNK